MTTVMEVFDDSYPLAIPLNDAAGVASFANCVLERHSSESQCCGGPAVHVKVHSVLLHWACANSRTDVAKKIAAEITDMSAKDKDGRTPLDIVAVYENIDIADALLRWKHEDAVDMAIALPGDLPVETRDLVLHWACKHNQVDIAEKLIEQGTYVGWKDDSGRTLLHYAAELGFRDVVELLLANKADADAADKEGKRPYQLTDGLLRRQLRKAIDEQKFAVLYAEDTVIPDVLKVCFIGSEGAGRTTLMESLRRRRRLIDQLFTKEDQTDDPFCEEERTVGINVLTVNVPGVGRLLLWDYSSLRQFHVSLGYLFSGCNSVFILLVSLVTGKERRVCSYEELRDETQYWLSFLRACLHRDATPIVLMAASRGDCYPDGQRVFKRVVDYMRELFIGTINISEVCFALDCRKSKSPQLRQLKNFLGDVKKQLVQSGPRYPRLCEPVVSTLLPSLRKKQDLFMETPALIDTIESELCPGQDKKIVEKVVDFVHDSGEVVRVHDVTALNPRWLCQYIIGPLLTSDEFPCYMRRKKNDGKVTRSEVEEALRQFFAANNIKIWVSVDVILTLLESLALAFKVEREYDTYQFPAHLPVKKLSVMWIADLSMKAFVGRRHFCSSVESIFSPSTFGLFQCQASIALDKQAVLWRDGIILRKVTRGRSPVQCLSAMSKPLGTVDFRVRGGEGSECDCYLFPQEVMSLWKEVMEMHSPGTEYETGYLSKRHLSEDREQPAMYSEEAVQQVKCEGPSAFVRVSTPDFDIAETLKDLMVFQPKDRASYTSNKVLRAVQKIGSGRWYALGLEMGFSLIEIDRITVRHIAYTVKLLALFSVKAEGVGTEHAEGLLMSACKNIEPPIYRDVVAELDTVRR